MKPVSNLLTTWLLLAITVSATAAMASENHGQHSQGKIDPDTIIDKVLQAYGGRAVLEKVKAIRYTGTIQSHRLGKTGNMTRLILLPGKLRVKISYPDGPHETRLTTPAGAWRDGRQATAPMQQAMALQAARFRLPLIMTQYPVKVIGEKDKLLRLGVRLSDSTLLEVVIDRGTWRIVRSVGHMVMGQMNMAFAADYADFRKVDGVLFAHRESLTAMGRRTGDAVLTRIEVNPKTRKQDFMPGQVI